MLKGSIVHNATLQSPIVVLANASPYTLCVCVAKLSVITLSNFVSTFLQSINYPYSGYTWQSRFEVDLCFLLMMYI